MSSDKEQYVLVEDLPDDLKKCYLGLLVWIVYSDDKQVDEQELCEIQVLMAQLKCNTNVRKAVRSYLEAPHDLDAEVQIAHVLKLVSEKNSFPLKCSLMKDSIRICRATSKGSVIEQSRICRLAKLLSLDSEKVEFLEHNCIQEEKLLSGKLSDNQIAKLMKDLSAKGTAVGVPLAAVYMSGSVVGLSATGITSGLAALGLGGVLGLSAMVTGIGTAVIAGVAVYKGVKYVLGGSERKRISLRELMLQGVLRTHQTAIANLAEDISSYGERIATLAKNTDSNRKVIDKFYQDMALMSAALTRLRGRVSDFERDLGENEDD